MKKKLVLFLMLITVLCSFNVCAQGTVDKIGVKNELILFDVSDFTKVYGSSLSKIKVDTLPKPAVGVLELKGVPLSENSEISSANIKKMTFRPARNFSGTTAFFWQGASLSSFSPERNLVRILITNQGTLAAPNINTIPNNVYPQTIETAPSAKPTTEPTIAPTMTVAPSIGTQAPTTLPEVTVMPTVSEKPSPAPTAEPVPTVVPEPTAVLKPTPKPGPPLYADMNLHWAEYTVGKLYALGVIKGEQVGTLKYFYPETKISRIDFIIMILAAEGITFDNYDVSQQIFADEKNYQLWIRKPAHAAYDNGILTGSLVNGTLYLNPNEPMTRLDALVVLNSAFHTPPSVLKVPEYADMYTVPDWGYDAIANLYSYGIIRGYPNANLRPYDTMTKAEAAEFVYQLIKGNNMLKAIK